MIVIVPMEFDICSGIIPSLFGVLVKRLGRRIRRDAMHGVSTGIQGCLSTASGYGELSEYQSD